MKRVLTIFLVIAILAAFSIPSVSQESPRQDSKATKENAEQKKQAPPPISIVEPSPAKDAKKKAKSNAETGGYKSEEWSLSDKIAIIASGVAFLQFIGIVLTVLVMMRNGRRELRAYVFIETAAVGYIKPKGAKRKILFADITVRNSGKTPAYFAVHWGNIAFMLNGTDDKLVLPQTLDMKSVTVIPPGGAISKTLKWNDGGVIPPQFIADYKKLANAIFVYGRLEYVDAFEKKRFTNYRLAIAGSWPPSPTVRLVFCDRGNETN
ncbi:MAG: hypothetical protein AB7O46_14670 [Xanthobacteraceae bacterium]